MKYKIRYCFFLLICSTTLFAQQITTNSVGNTPICTNTSFSISFQTTGFVTTRRSFAVQLSDALGNFATPTPLTTTRTSPVAVSIPNTVLAGTTYRIRVVTDTTGVQYVATPNFSVQNLPSATLSGGATINVGDSTRLQITFTGGGVYNYAFTNNTIGTSTTAILNGFVKPTVSTTYRLQSVANSCGMGIVAGSATVTVNPRISTGSVGSNVCAGNIVAVPFSITGAFASAVVYTAQLSDINGSFQTPLAIGTATASPVMALLPATFVGSGYRIRVIANADAIAVSSPAFSIRPRPTAAISGNSTINVGQAASLNLTFTGDAPFTYTLSNGTTGVASVSSAALSVMPAATTTYTLQSVTNACGAGTVTGSAKINVTPRINTDLSINSACANETINVPFTVTGLFENAVTYNVQLSNIAGEFANPITIGTGSTSPLKAQIPANTLAGNNYKIRVIANQNNLSVGSNAILIKPLPTANISGGNTINFGDAINLNLTFTGTAPWTFRLSDGTTGTADKTPYAIALKPIQTTTYSIASVQNSCGIGSTMGSATVTVLPRLATENINSPACALGLVTVRFGIGGVLPINTSYQAQLSDSLGSFSKPIAIGLGNSSPINAILPNLPSGGNYKIRVVTVGGTTNVLPTEAFAIKRKPTASISGGNPQLKPGNEAILVVQFTGDAPWSYELSDAKTLGSASISPLVISVTPDYSITYTLKSVANVCGEGTVAGSAVVNVLITSLDQNLTEGVTILPNPFTKNIYIKTTTTTKSGSWQLMNMNGIVLKEKSWTAQKGFTTVIDTESLPAGTYLLKTTIDDQHTTHKVTKL
jgi:Secretion system C-terminal sorting domain